MNVSQFAGAAVALEELVEPLAALDEGAEEFLLVVPGDGHGLEAFRDLDLDPSAAEALGPSDLDVHEFAEPGQVALEGGAFSLSARNLIPEAAEVGAETVAPSLEFALHSLSVAVPDGFDPVEFPANGVGDGGDPGEDGTFIRSVADRGETALRDPCPPIDEEPVGKSGKTRKKRLGISEGGGAPGFRIDKVGGGPRVGGLEFREGGGIVVADLLEPGSLLVQLPQLAVAGLQFVIQPGDHPLSLDHLPPGFTLSGREALLALNGLVKLTSETADFVVAGPQLFIALSQVGSETLEERLERRSGTHRLVSVAAELVDLPHQNLAFPGEGGLASSFRSLDFRQGPQRFRSGLPFILGRRPELGPGEKDQRTGLRLSIAPTGAPFGSGARTARLILGTPQVDRIR